MSLGASKSRQSLNPVINTRIGAFCCEDSSTLDSMVPLLPLLLSSPRRRRLWKAQAPTKRATPRATATDCFVGAEDVISVATDNISFLPPSFYSNSYYRAVNVLLICSPFLAFLDKHWGVLANPIQVISAKEFQHTQDWALAWALACQE